MSQLEKERSNASFDVQKLMVYLLIEILPKGVRCFLSLQNLKKIQLKIACCWMPFIGYCRQRQAGGAGKVRSFYRLLFYKYCCLLVSHLSELDLFLVLPVGPGYCVNPTCARIARIGRQSNRSHFAQNRYMPLFSGAPFDNQAMDEYLSYEELFEKKIERVAAAFKIVRDNPSFLFAHMKQKVKMEDVFVSMIAVGCDQWVVAWDQSIHSWIAERIRLKLIPNSTPQFGRMYMGDRLC